MTDAERTLALLIAICGEHIRPMVVAKLVKLSRR
jgi:hypothetical protein